MRTKVIKRFFPDLCFYSLQPRLEKTLTDQEYMLAVRPIIYADLEEIGVVCRHIHSIMDDGEAIDTQIFLRSLIRLCEGHLFNSEIKIKNNKIVEEANKAFKKNELYRLKFHQLEYNYEYKN